MYTNREQILSVRDKLQSRGQEYIGNLVSLSVRGMDGAGVTLRDLRRVVLDNPDLPDEWAPESPSELTMYLSTMVELGRSSSLERRFLPNFEGEYEIDPNLHRQYSVTRMFMRSNDEVVCAHKIIHMEKDEITVTRKGVTMREIRNIEADEGIQIYLKRTVGTKATDTTGGSDWEFHLFNNNQQRIDVHECVRYLPFIRTLEAEFTKKRNEIYQNKEILDVVNRILWDHLGVFPVNKKGLYFVHRDKALQAGALAMGLRKLNPNIDLFNHEIGRYLDDPEPDDLCRMVGQGITEHLQNQMAALIESLESMKDNAATRDSTWLNRQEELLTYTEQIKDMKRLRLIEEELLRKQYFKAVALLKAGLEGEAEES